MKILVFTPTWNESENIVPLVKEVFKTVPEAHMLIVDDQSPDGTGRLAEAMIPEYPNLHVYHRQGPRGRGWAGIAAYIWALDHGAERIIEMDADFSHQPRYIPDLLAALEHADMVLGSRFVPGGKDLRPGKHRHIISRCAGKYQQWMFRAPVKDCTSGFRGYRGHVLEQIGVRELNTWGPAILSDVLFRVIRHNFRIVEVPIIFPDRERGESTLTCRILFEGLWNVTRLRLASGRAVSSKTS